jgi:iron(III) transport system substrate-binding protein
MSYQSSAAGLIAAFLLSVIAASALAQNESLDEIYKRAQKEGGTLNCYCSLAQINAEKIYPMFEKRFPGLRINHVDATSDKLSARAITEARGGKTLADIVEFGLEDINKIYEQGLLLEKAPPEAAAYPADLRGPYWTANNLIFFVGAWNTDKVKKDEEPKAFDGFGDPRWKGRLIAEPRDYEILVALTHKHKSLEKARAVLARIAANDVEFHKGHSQLAELLVAGQAAACFTCYSHHYPERKRKGAPVDYMLSEGAAGIIGVAVLKNAPHPNTAWLFNRWAASEEGQTVYSKGGRTPAHPKVEPTENIRPKVIYAVGVEDLKQYSKYEKVWKEVFKLR